MLKLYSRALVFVVVLAAFVGCAEWLYRREPAGIVPLPQFVENLPASPPKVEPPVEPTAIAAALEPVPAPTLAPAPLPECMRATAPRTLTGCIAPPVAKAPVAKSKPKKFVRRGTQWTDDGRSLWRQKKRES